MTESEKRTEKNFSWLFITAFISLVVGVGGGLIINKITEKKTALEYNILTSQVFSGQKQNIAILNLQISNPGNKELENFICRISFLNAELTEQKVIGLQKGTYTSNQGTNYFELKSPFINPTELFSVQLLLSLKSSELITPIIEIRGKGVIGKKKEDIDSPKIPIILLFATSIFTLLPVIFFLVLKIRPQTFFTVKHSDDQRDILFYIYSINGFIEEAENIKQSNRKVSYWSESDYLTDHCIKTQDVTMMRRGVKTLQDLIDYANIADTSILLIYYNIARLAAHSNDDEIAKKYLWLACKGNHKVIKKRILYDDKLKEIKAAMNPFYVKE